MTTQKTPITAEVKAYRLVMRNLIHSFHITSHAQPTVDLYLTNRRSGNYGKKRFRFETIGERDMFVSTIQSNTF